MYSDNQHQRRPSNTLPIFAGYDSQNSIPEPLTMCLDQLRNEVQKIVDEDQMHHLRARQLESELGLYKNAYARLEDQNHRLAIEKLELEKLIGDACTQVQDFQKQAENMKIQLKGHRITVLIDGDGTIFEDKLISQGQAGGHIAAEKLSDSITQHLTKVNGTYQYQVRVYVFLNKRGLADTLGRAGFPTARARFDDFMMGFNIAAERFIMVDVGSVKEAADAKIKALLEDDIKLPQTEKIIFAGCHDNGYATTLRSQITAGFKDKLILLRGYNDMANGLSDLELPVFSIPDLFMTRKLVVSPGPFINITTAPSAPPGLTVKGFGGDHEETVNAGAETPEQQAFEALPFSSAEIPAGKASVTSYSSAVQTRAPKAKRANTPDLDSGCSTASSDEDDSTMANINIRAPLTATRARRVNPNIPLSKQKPPPCTLFYLSNCKHGADCKYGHDYELNEEHYEEIRVNAKKSPCPSKNKGEMCLWGEDCCYGHHCPLTTKCHWFKQNRCKFIGDGMHKEQKAQLTEVM